MSVIAPAKSRRPDPTILRIATYNVHRCRGMDRRTLPRRIADVLRPLHADVIALQEVIGAGPHGHAQDEELGAALGMGWVMAPARYRRGHLFGNVVLSRFPIVYHTQHDISWKRRTRHGMRLQKPKTRRRLPRSRRLRIGTLPTARSLEATLP